MTHDYGRKAIVDPARERLAPIIIKTNSKKAAWWGGFCCLGFCGAIYWLFQILRGDFAIEGMVLLAAIFFAILFAGSAVNLIGIAVRRPTALRMDEVGISGYYVKPLEWSQIAEISIHKDYPNNGFVYLLRIGIKLADPDAFMKGQTLWQRLNMRHLARKSGFHITIRPILEQEVSFAGIVRQANILQAAAAEQAFEN